MTMTGKIALFLSGTLFGSAGFIILGSKDAKSSILHREHTIANGDPVCDYWITGDKNKT